MSKQKNVTIPYDLFLDLVKYFKCDMVYLAPKITDQLNDKFNRIIIRDLYNDFINAATPEEKQLAKEKYLNARGIPKDFRF